MTGDLVVVGLGGTLVDRVGAFRLTTELFACEHGLGRHAVKQIVSIDGAGCIRVGR
ncbi:hypothetical protein J2W54_002799 [Rhodococcus fascians]|uniref:hypothetical protein n=1 Tax=Nocardiaceae TaxID=85025 RepID=UPI00286539BF|nr:MULTISPECIES: hypothetical protein [Rhodococcus]MDR6910846.1 hypothetical protein [Rhodococcus sp. 3258]MDR6932405.1 hypothetical protein [Rhodococcus fascians]